MTSCKQEKRKKIKNIKKHRAKSKKKYRSVLLILLTSQITLNSVAIITVCLSNSQKIYIYMYRERHVCCLPSLVILNRRKRDAAIYIYIYIYIYIFFFLFNFIQDFYFKKSKQMINYLATLKITRNMLK